MRTPDDGGPPRTGETGTVRDLTATLAGDDSGALVLVDWHEAGIPRLVDPRSVRRA